MLKVSKSEKEKRVGRLRIKFDFFNINNKYNNRNRKIFTYYFYYIFRKRTSIAHGKSFNIYSLNIAKLINSNF
jgi:hypothetical protein